MNPIYQAVQAADLYAKGIPPVSGGSLDQANWFNEFATRMWSDENRLKAELGIY